jgi:serine/threonine protein kinase
MDATSDTASDDAMEIAGEGLQVARVQNFGDRKQERRAFEEMSVHIIADGRNPLYKRLLMSKGSGHEMTVSLRGATAWMMHVYSTHPEDVQPSFAEHSVCISIDHDARISWLVASPTPEDQCTLLDRLCAAGCIMRDLQDQIKMLPSTAHPSQDLRLGRASLSRGVPKEEIVALKLATDEEKMEQMLNEVQVLLNLQHDQIVRAYGIYELKVNGEHSLGMVLDYKKGKDLSSWISIVGLPERIIRGMMAQLCDALVYLHELSVVHRDIKLSNVLCEPAENGSVKVALADFGLAANIMDKERISARCGTVGYIAPEVFREDWRMQLEEEPVTNVLKIDVFSFGIMIYTAVFGRNPFVDTDATEHASRVRNARGLVSFANMGGRSKALQSLLSGLCAKDRRQRYSSSEALAHPWFSSDRGDGCKLGDVTWAAFVQAAEFGDAP